jgi:hypothetical protein
MKNIPERLGSCQEWLRKIKIYKIKKFNSVFSIDKRSISERKFK